MIKYICKISEEFIEVVNRTATTPVLDTLFQVRAEELAEHLTEELAVAFCHAQGAHIDIHPPTSFLTQRIKKLDRDDWGNY
jgi:NTP pyrophosphatase (non-canonical NTP hydrolase)